MYACLPDASFELDGIFENVLDLLGAVLVFVFQFRKVLHAVRQFRLEFLLDLLAVFHDFGFERLVRNHFRQSVGLVHRHVADAAHILDGAFGGHCSKRDYM